MAETVIDQPFHIRIRPLVRAYLYPLEGRKSEGQPFRACGRIFYITDGHFFVSLPLHSQAVLIDGHRKVQTQSITITIKS